MLYHAQTGTVRWSLINTCMSTSDCFRTRDSLRGPGKHCIMHSFATRYTAVMLTCMRVSVSLIIKLVTNMVVSLGKKERELSNNNQIYTIIVLGDMLKHLKIRT